MGNRSASRYEAQTPSRISNSMMSAPVYVIINSILWLGVLAIAWPMFMP